MLAVTFPAELDAKQRVTRKERVEQYVVIYDSITQQNNQQLSKSRLQAPTSPLSRFVAVAYTSEAKLPVFETQLKCLKTAEELRTAKRGYIRLVQSIPALHQHFADFAGNVEQFLLKKEQLKNLKEHNQFLDSKLQKAGADLQEVQAALRAQFMRG